MLNVIWITIPVYVLIGLGYAAVRSGYIPGDSVPALSRFALRICLPALVFSAIAVPRQGALFDLPLMAGYLLASLAALAIGGLVMRFAFRQSAPLSWIFGLGMSSCNSGFMGFPIVSLIVAPGPAAQFLAMAIVIENVVMIPLGVIGAQSAGRHSAGLRATVAATLATAVRNPLLVSVLAALAIRFSGLPLPQPVVRSLSMLAAVAPTVALFVVGATVARYPVSTHWRRTGAIVLGKLVLHPALVLLAVTPLAAHPSQMATIAVLFAGMPMMSIFPILGEPFGGDQVCATSLIVSTALSFVTISLWSVLLAV